MSWNSYPKQVHNSLLKRLNSNINKTEEQTVDDCTKIWLNLPYLGDKGNHLTKTLIRKLNKCFNENVKFIKRYKTNKLGMFCFVVTRIIFSFNRKLVLFIELRVQVVTISTLEKLAEIL